MLLTERHETARIDRQLEGCCARQGDPGSFEAFALLQDSILGGERLALWLPGLATIAHGAMRWLGVMLVRRVQRHLEKTHARSGNHAVIFRTTGIGAMNEQYIWEETSRCFVGLAVGAGNGYGNCPDEQGGLLESNEKVAVGSAVVSQPKSMLPPRSVWPISLLRQV